VPHDDLDAAARAARYLSSGVSSIRALAAAGVGEEAVQRLATRLSEDYSGARDAIHAVAMELRLTRDSSVRLGDIVAPTAHEAAVAMVYALNMERFGESLGIQVLGRERVQVWPDQSVVSAEIQLESTKARYRRDQASAASTSGGRSIEATTKRVVGISTPEVAERLERLRTQGEPWTSYHKLARQLGCSSQTIHKAARSTPKLAAWAKQPGSAPRAQSINRVVTDRATQHRELLPEDEVAIREFIEQADPETSAWFQALPAEEQLAYLDDPDEHTRILGRRP
jgi:hypothetical protein